jgi:hypothetical protein
VDRDALDRSIDAFIDEQRARCLWFVRPEYYPSTDEARLSMLGKIERAGDLAAFKRCGELRARLLQRSSVSSAAS